MTLTEFLLARIAEDAGAALKRMHHAQENYLLLQDPKYLGRLIPGWYEWPEIEADAAVRLVECEAKRRIIDWHDDREDCCEERYGGFRGVSDPTISVGTTAMGQLSTTRVVAYQEYLGCVTLAHLALPYADHPDYNPEWRP